MTKKQKREMYLGMIVFVLIFASFVFFTGCESIDSVKIGGGYTAEDGTKIEGDVEIVLSETETKSLGIPYFTSNAGNFVLISEKQAQKIVEKIEPDKKNIVPNSAFKSLAEKCK
ncbi:MAG: hypothetical protein WC445_04740 [Patescibacteria group bacterium]